MAIYAYCRLQTTCQPGPGEAPSDIMCTVEAYATRCGLRIDDRFLESGPAVAKPLFQRPEGFRLLYALQPGDAILTASLNCMFRTATDAANVSNRLTADGISLHVVDLGGDITEPGISTMFFSILSSLAAGEREQSGKPKPEGHRTGGRVPFGYRRDKDGQMVPHAAEQAAIHHMVEMQQTGWSLRAIVRRMESDGFHLSHAGVQKVLDAAEFRRVKDSQAMRKFDQGAWDAGFAAGVANDVRYPYDPDDVIKSCSWYAGWMEGEANRGLARQGQTLRKRAG